MTARASMAVGEEARAATQAVLGLSVGVGGLAAAAAALIGDPLAVIGLPATALGVALARGATAPAGYAAAGVWLALLPRVSAEGLLVPLAMSLVCLAIAVGPRRLEWWTRRPEAGSDGDEGWIEEH